MWTGDNLGTWEHMAVGIKMVLANGIAGMSFAGCESSTRIFPLPCISLIPFFLSDACSGRGGLLWESRTGDIG